jgi:hypothetical protein
MAVVYDPHLEERLRERHIPETWPREIIETATERYRDTVTGVYVAIGKRWYKGKEREMAVSYVEQGTDRKAITIHPIQANQKQNRIAKGRWVKV